MKTTWEDAARRGAALGFKLLEKVSLGSSAPMLWECGACKHAWRARLANFEDGRGCPACSGRAPLTFEVVAHRAALKGFKLLTLDDCAKAAPIARPTGARRAVLQCEQGHIWSARADSVGRRGCAKCRAAPHEPA